MSLSFEHERYRFDNRLQNYYNSLPVALLQLSPPLEYYHSYVVLSPPGAHVVRPEEWHLGGAIEAMARLIGHVTTIEKLAAIERLFNEMIDFLVQDDQILLEELRFTDFSDIRIANRRESF